MCQKFSNVHIKKMEKIKIQPIAILIIFQLLYCTPLLHLFFDMHSIILLFFSVPLSRAGYFPTCIQETQCLPEARKSQWQP